jgi:hypothetical protein
MTQKRHEILGRALRTSVEVCLDCMAQEEAMYIEVTAPGKPHQAFARESQIRWAVRMAVMEHLGYGPIEDLPKRLNDGVDKSLEYFFGDWWQTDDADARGLDKSGPDRALRWFDILPNALLLCGLADRWDDLSRICSWFDDTVQLEYRGGLNEDADMILYLCIASSMSQSPPADMDAMLAHVKSGRARRPKLLCAAWEAARGGDQKVFDKSFQSSVQQFLKSDAEDAPNPYFWVAVRQSFVWLLAERNGLAFPELPVQLDAAVVRRQTIGLA